MSVADDIAALEAKLATYRIQLEQVTSALAVNSNEELKQLQTDIQQAITLAQQAIAEKKAQQQQQQQPPVVPAPAAASTPSADAPPATTTTTNTTTSTDISKLVPGARVQALWRNSRQWHNAEIQDITNDGKYRVAICGYAQETVVDKDSLRLYNPTKKRQLLAGTECFAVYGEDNRWYRARIDDVYPNDGGYLVTYPQYGNSEQRDGFYIAVANDLQTRGVHTGESGDAMAVPATVALTMEQRQAKRKRKKALNLKAKMQKLDEETKKVQTSWQAFKSKAVSKGKAGVRKKASMFQSPDTVDGKVGVVGSGKGVTEFQDRGKHQFQPK